jgi:hypothetical protein
MTKPGDGFAQPPAHVAGHGLPVQQPCAAAGVACLLKQPVSALETALRAGLVPGRKVDDRAGCQGLAQGRRLALGLRDRELDQFLAAIYAGGSGFEDRQLG